LAELLVALKAALRAEHLDYLLAAYSVDYLVAKKVETMAGNLAAWKVATMVETKVATTAVN
jgi:hypothetical protein